MDPRTTNRTVHRPGRQADRDGDADRTALNAHLAKRDS